MCCLCGVRDWVQTQIPGSVKGCPHRAAAAAANTSQWWRLGMGLGPIFKRHNAFQWDLAAAVQSVHTLEWYSHGSHFIIFRNGCHSRWPTKFSTTRSSGVRHNRGLSSGSASSYINRAPHDTIWPQKEGVCLEQNISIGSNCMAQGHFMLHFTTFHNVSIYVKWPQKLVIKLKIEVFSFRCKSPSWTGEP